VGGKNLIKMYRLKDIFESVGMKNVRTYIQSGNVLFDSSIGSEEEIIEKIESAVHKELSKEVILIVRTPWEFDSIIKLNPFGKIKHTSTTKFYTTFLKDKLKKKPLLPLKSDNKNVEIIQISGREIYAAAKEINGKFGFPNNFIENYLGIKATTRNWNTVLKMSELIIK
jgi:uncharacterized protein (DUF1697 family)